MQAVLFEDLGTMRYQNAWIYQEALLAEMVARKTKLHSDGLSELENRPSHRLLFVEHPAVYTLGKSGKMENVLISGEELEAKGIEFFKINRGGDITFHGIGQLVGYPLLDLEQFYTDIGRYLRNIEEVIIRTLDYYGLVGERSAGETGVWLDASIPGRERKICAIGVRCSRWVTMHGFAFNVNTDLGFFDHIIPCGIRQKQVTSLQKELGSPLDLEEVKSVVKSKFEEVFDVQLLREND
ncbi:MAG TPA: lipoyl(octanoyl) transferase LipB [Flavitalea sp.]|nr:lipoyl(octanoyl) transferase LipB [Flavitalea sp.]